MTRREIVVKAIAGELSWVAAARILGVSDRHMRRMRERYEEWGVDGLRDGRAGQPRTRRVSADTIAEVCRLKRDVYPDFSMKHFHEKVTETHRLALSYTLMRSVLQDAGLVEKAPGRGKYRRKRERRPMVGMMLHMDASTHEWIPGQPRWDLNVVLDDADGRILFARFFEQEGTHSTLTSLHAVLTRHGRFTELSELFAARAAGVRIVLISDSCHSGTVARFAPLSTPATTKGQSAPRRTVRFLPPATFLGKQAIAKMGVRSMRPSSPPGRHHGLLMSGCQDTEYSYDAWFGGRPNGAFTFVALRELNELPAGRTYQQWHAAIRKARDESFS